MRVDESVLSILESSTIINDLLVLPPQQLPRKQYEAVNKCLELLGGKWNRKARGHAFDGDPSDILEVVIRTGIVSDEKKEYQFFQTSPEVVAQMLDMASLVEEDSALEPSAGRGAIASEMRKRCQVTVIELNPRNAASLRADGFEVLEMDFLQYGGGGHSKIVMNPPFSRQQDIDHILHAYKILKPSGVLVSVVSESPFFRDNAKSQQFRAFLERVGANIVRLPEGSFEDSGTGVRTRLIEVCK